jgi:ComF family protein
MGKKASERWVHASRLALDLLFPPRCAGCGDLGLIWCAKCQAGVRLISKPLCEHCGFPLRQTARCAACADHRYVFTASRSWGVYAGELRQAILSLKHRSNASLGAVFAKSLVKVFQAQDWNINLLIPIPLGPQRLRQRGYNQIDLLARPFAELAGLRYAESVLIRRHETLPQFELNALQRWENLHGSFVADPVPLAGLSVLVIDDIMTTGATLDSAAQALREAGAKKVYAITLARALAEGSDA